VSKALKQIDPETAAKAGREVIVRKRGPKSRWSFLLVEPASGPSRIAIATARFNSITGDGSMWASKL